MTSARSVRNTLSKARVNLASWSRSRNRVDNSRSFNSIVAFLACWVTQVESGWAVTPTATTCLVLTWMKNKTYRVCSQIVSTVRKSQATIPSAWPRRNCAQVGPVRSWRRTQAVLSQQRPDGRGAYPNAELAQLPADPHAAPPGILPGHPKDQFCGLRVDRWPARRALLAVGPLAPDQCAVPAQQRLGRDEQRCPPLSGEHPAGGGEQDPVACGELGRAALAAQHPKLMPQYQDLQVLGAVVAVRKEQQTGQQADGQPKHEEHRGMLRNACSRRESAFPRPTGSTLNWSMATASSSTARRSEKSCGSMACMGPARTTQGVPQQGQHCDRR